MRCLLLLLALAGAASGADPTYPVQGFVEIATTSFGTAAAVGDMFNEVEFAVHSRTSGTYSVFGTDFVTVDSEPRVTVTSGLQLDDWEADNAALLAAGDADSLALATAVGSVLYSGLGVPVEVALSGLVAGEVYTLSLLQVARTDNNRRDYVEHGESGDFIGNITCPPGDAATHRFSFAATGATHSFRMYSYERNVHLAGVVLQRAAAFVSFSNTVITSAAQAAGVFESVLHAVSMDGVDTFTVFGVDLTPENETAGVEVLSVTWDIDDYFTPTTLVGGTADDAALTAALSSMRGSHNANLPVVANGLTPGGRYAVSIFVAANDAFGRSTPLYLNGDAGATDFAPLGRLESPVEQVSVTTVEFYAAKDSHRVEAHFTNEGPDGFYRSPILNAVVVQDLGACPADGSPAFPTLLQSSAIDSAGNLVLDFFASGTRYLKVGWEFPGATAGACGDAAGSGQNGWEHGASECPGIDRHTLTVPLTAALSECGFSAEPVDGGDTWYYEAVAEATTVENSTAVFGDEQNRTELTTFRVRVAFPKNASVSASNVVYGPTISQARVTTQLADTSVAPAAFEWTLATSVQYPYELVAPATTDAAPAGFDAALAVSGSETCSGADECTQRFTVSGTASASTCSLDSSAALTFTVKCRDGFTGSCDLPSPATVAASFSFETDDFCPQVVEVASITPSLTTYSDSGRTSVSTNYILETTLFARVTADVEAGLRAKRTTLTGLDIVSSCSTCTPLVQPFPDTSAALAAYDFAWEDGGTDNSATGEVETDFSFTLNTNSLSFDNDASTGEAQITLTAYVSVEYDTPSAQGLKRSYRVQAVSGPGSVGSSASANFGVSSAPAGGTTGGSSSTAGSTVLGVSAGTAALAAVGLAAVAAVAFGAAVAARRRRRAAPLKQTSSSASLELGAAGLVPAPVTTAVPGMATNDLSGVQDAYGAVRV